MARPQDSHSVYFGTLHIEECAGFFCYFCGMKVTFLIFLFLVTIKSCAQPRIYPPEGLDKFQDSILSVNSIVKSQLGKVKLILVGFNLKLDKFGFTESATLMDSFGASNQVVEELQNYLKNKYWHKTKKELKKYENCNFVYWFRDTTEKALYDNYYRKKIVKIKYPNEFVKPTVKEHNPPPIIPDFKLVNRDYTKLSKEINGGNPDTTVITKKKDTVVKTVVEKPKDFQIYDDTSINTVEEHSYLSDFLGGKAMYQQLRSDYFGNHKHCKNYDRAVHTQIKFVVYADGSVGDFYLKGFQGSCDIFITENIIFLKELPPFKPALINGKRVNSYKSIYVSIPQNLMYPQYGY